MNILKSIFFLLPIAIGMSACEQQDPKPKVQYGVPFVYNSSAVVTTIAGRSSIGNQGNVDGNLATARFGILSGLAFDSQNNLFVVDNMFNTIRKITPSGEVTTFAGNKTKGHVDGIGKHASFNEPFGIAIDSDDNLYIADFGNNCIRKITPAGEVTTFAGSTEGIAARVDGIGTTARFRGPINLALDPQGNLYVTQEFNVRKITSSGVVTTLAGNDHNGYLDGQGMSAYFSYPDGIGVGPDGNIYVADSGNPRVRKITPAGMVSTFAGTPGSNYADGVGLAAIFNGLSGMTIDASGNLYIINLSIIQKITSDSVVTSIAGGNGSPFIEDGVGCKSSFRYPSGITLDADGNIYVTEECLIRKITIK